MNIGTRKLIWSAPLAAVFAIVGGLALFVALSPTGAQADHVDLPGIVMDVKAEAKGRDTIDLTWKAPSSGGAVDYYRIDRSLPGDNDNWMRLVPEHTGSTSYTDMMGLKANKSYDYRVFAVNAAGTGPSSDQTENSMATTNDTSKPGPVRMLTAKVMGPAQINLSWYPPESDGGAGITRYCISTAPDGHEDNLVTPTDGDLLGCSHNMAPTEDASEAFNDGTTTSGNTDGRGVIVILAPKGDAKVEFMHKKLPASGSREYEVYAVNSKGISTSAVAVAPKPQTDAAGKPSAPILRVVANAVADIDLYWTWPADNGGATIVDFDVDVKVGNGDWDSLDGNITLADQAPDATASIQLEDQTITGTTSYRVRANNGVKASGWSNTVTIRTTGADATLAVAPASAAPLAVAGLPQTIPNAQLLRQINLTWTDVANTSYLIDYRKSGDTSTWMSLQGNTGYSKSTYNHRNLKPDDDDDAPTADAPAPVDADYIYRVFPLKSGAYGPAALGYGSTAMAEKPAAVIGLKTSSDDPTKIKLEWSKPTEDGGESITGYRIEIGLDNSWPDPTSATDPTPSEDDCPAIPAGSEADYLCVREVEGADTTMYTLDKLKAGNVRWFRVFAINKVSMDDDGEGTPADAFPDATDSRRAQPKKGTSLKHGTPGVPLDLTVQPARDANEEDPAKLGIDLLWNLPAAASGDSVTGYVIARRTKASSTADWSAWDDDWGTITGEGSDFEKTSFTDDDEPDNIANGEMREYKVAAKSGTGMGKFTSTVVYPVDTSHEAVAEPEVGAATGVTTGPFNEGGVIQVNWDAAPNATGYIIYAVNVDELDQDDGQVVVVPVNDAAAETFNLGGLNSGDTYDIYVVATAKEMVAWPASDDVVQVAAN